MSTIYFKRYRMEIALEGDRFRESVALPPPYRWTSWNDGLIERHAATKYRSFRDELDSEVFPCLGELDGCDRLIRDIRSRSGFVPEATWLVSSPAGDCATIQGVVDLTGLGAIQNVGVVPEHRRRGLGEALVRQALAGFRSVGIKRVYLEVTAENIVAVSLYRRIGFLKTKSLYRAVRVPDDPSIAPP